MTASQDLSQYAATPVDDLRIALQEAAGLKHEASRIAVALRGIGNTIADEDQPIAPENVAGLCEAVSLVGDYLEGYAEDRCALLERIEAERRRTAGATVEGEV